MCLLSHLGGAPAPDAPSLHHWCDTTFVKMMFHIH